MPEFEPEKNTSSNQVGLEHYKDVLDNIRTMVFEWGDDGTAAYMSPQIPKFLWGRYDSRPLFVIWREDAVISPADMALFEKFLDGIADGQKVADVTVRLKKRDGHYAWCNISFSVLSGSGEAAHYICSISDVDAATRNMEVLRFRAEYDALTGVHNRASFIEKVSAELDGFPGDRHFILRFDVANFKRLNEFLGMEEGDRLLVKLAHLCRRNMNPERETVCRLSGDMFVVCLVGDLERVTAFIGRVSEGVRDFSPSCKVSVFFGICEVTGDATPVHIWSAHAQEALLTVKGNDSVNYAHYNAPLRDRLLEENRITRRMHAALRDGEFVPFLQPKVSMHTGKLVGAEALVRWIHPEEGVISPGVFIPLFERNGFIVRLDEYMWEATCKLLRMWLDKGFDPMPVSVNVSRVHFLDEQFGKKIVALVDKYRLPRHLLELEITESGFFGNERALVRAMKGLQQEGFHFSMDDFGTGYSSLGTLRSLPFNIIKLDRSFVSDGTDNPRGQVVARHTVAMAKELQMRIVAEGVETEEQARFMLSIGCTVAQGYFYSTPIDADSFEILAYVQHKSFWVTPALQQAAILQGLPAGDDKPHVEC